MREQQAKRLIFTVRLSWDGYVACAPAALACLYSCTNLGLFLISLENIFFTETTLQWKENSQRPTIARRVTVLICRLMKEPSWHRRISQAAQPPAPADPSGSPLLGGEPRPEQLTPPAPIKACCRGCSSRSAHSPHPARAQADSAADPTLLTDALRVPLLTAELPLYPLLCQRVSSEPQNPRVSLPPPGASPALRRRRPWKPSRRGTPQPPQHKAPAQER